MSHTTTVDSVKITDVAALSAAVEELKANGIDCDLLQDALPRAYYPTQAGMDEKAPFVLKLNKGQYDIGFYEKEGVYEARFDNFMNRISEHLGTAQEGKDSAQNAIGKVLNLYSVHAVSRKASMQGYRVQRVNNSDGSVQLRIAA